MKRSAVWDFLLGRPITVLLTVGVTVSSLLLAGNVRVLAATATAIALVAHSTISWSRDRGNERRMNQRYASILERLLQLLSDLGDLTGQDHGLWRIEVYVQRTKLALSFRRPLLRKRFMVPTLSLALNMHRHRHQASLSITNCSVNAFFAPSHAYGGMRNSRPLVHGPTFQETGRQIFRTRLTKTLGCGLGRLA